MLAYIGIAGVLTVRQTSFWQNDRVMWQHTLEVDGDKSAVAHAALALYEFEFPHDVDSCIRHFRRALELKPRFVEGCFHVYQFALCEKGLIEEASALLDRAQQWSNTEQDRVAEIAAGMGGEVERRNLPPYALSRIANFINTQGMTKVAEEELDVLAECLPRHPYVFYLKRMAALKRGDVDAARTFGELLKGADATTDYIRFRYFKLANENEKQKEGT